MPDNETAMRNNLDKLAACIEDDKVNVNTEISAPTGMATEETLATMQADIALMKADLAAIRAILES